MDKNNSEEQKNINTEKKRGKTSNSANTTRIKELRDKLGLTQQDFANELNRDFQMISHIERGTKGLTLPFAIEISKKFGVSLDWLYELSDDTGDYASNIIDDLRKVFKLDFEKKTITIDNELSKFLEKLNSAYKTKSEQNMPDEAFNAWIDKIKKDYNEEVSKPKKISTGIPMHGTVNIKVPVTYYLQTVKEHFREKTPTTVIEDFSNK